MKTFAELAFTPAVQSLQTLAGSRETYARMQAAGDPESTITEREAAFFAQADSFFLATVGETGWPYVQHRGGPRGFVRVTGPAQLAFADFRGNRQYVTVGNSQGEDRASIIVMDYPNRRRLKLLGHLRFIDAATADPALVRAVDLAEYKARVERIALFEVAAFDWNCPQHITPRYTMEEIEALNLG